MRLLSSGLAETAMVVGWITPVILVPGSAFTSLTHDQLRSILAHELAHIRRYDHLVNMAQGVIEIILFFHPTVWWISKQLHLEREHCCDDSSLRTTPNRKTLAEALARMESLRMSNPTTALAANGGSLMNRISRILGTQTERSTSTAWRTPMALAIGAIILTLGVSQAATTPAPHDPEAVGRRLREAVAAGELTAEQAKAMMHALKKATGHKDEGDIDLAALGRRLKAAVAAGKLTEEQARAKWETITKGAAKKDKAAGKKDKAAGKKDKAAAKNITREDLAQAGLKIRRAVAEGKITAEEGRAKMDAMRKMAAGQGERGAKRLTKKDYARAEAKLRKMVAAGEISGEDARARLDGMRKMIAAQSKRDGDARKRDIDPEGLRRRLAAAVESGSMTKSEAKAKFHEIMKWGDRGAKRITREDYARAEAKLKKAVAEGKISPEDARARLQAMRKKMGEQGKRPRETRKEKRGDIDWERIKRRVEGAVESGKMTREEADAKYAELKKGTAR